MPTLNWGLLSTARINESLIPAIRPSSRNKLHAVASRSADRAEAYASEWGIPVAYGRYDDLLKDPDLDVVYNPLPNHLHVEWTVAAAEHGLHVLCEKPMALTIEGIHAIQDAADRNGVVIAEAFMYRYHPRTRRVKDLIEEGLIGGLRSIQGAFTYNLQRSNDVRLDPEKGGGSLWDVGCYPVSFALYITDSRPREVYGSKVMGPTGVDMEFAGQIQFENNRIAQFCSSFQAHRQMAFRITGTEGIIDLPRAYKPKTTSTIEVTEQRESHAVPVRAMELYRYEVEAMADAVQEGKSPAVSLGESERILETLLALLASAENGAPVSL